jgi:NAD(P)H-flavin reductase
MIAFARPQLFKATVAEKIQLTKTVYYAKYRLIEPSAIQYYAGQTIMIRMAPGVNRAMSIANPPQETTVIHSVQDVSPGGPGSQWMVALKEGQPLEFMAPLGRFVVDHESQRKRVMVATGTGIAPFLSMLGDEAGGLKSGKDISLYWGLRYAEDVYLQDEMNAMKAAYPNFTYSLTLSKPQEGWTGLTGHTTEHVLAHEQDPKNCDFYLCGNKNMIFELTEKLESMGVPKAQMKFDPYY